MSTSSASARSAPLVRAAGGAPAQGGACARSVASLAPELLCAICLCLEPEDVARLMAACRALRAACAERELWAALLARRFGGAADPAGELDPPAHPSRTLARLAVCARWGLRPSGASAATEADWPPSPENEDARALAQRARALRSGASPDARKTLSYLDLNASAPAPPDGGCGGRTPPSAPASVSEQMRALSLSAPTACAAAVPAVGTPASARAAAPSTPAPRGRAPLCLRRLKRDLLELVGAGAGAVSAFPAQEDMLLWHATVRGLPGRPDERVVFKCSLAFGRGARAAERCAADARSLAELASAERTARRAGRRAHARDFWSAEPAAGDEADGGLLPAVRIASPAVRHPNVDKRGHVCAAALGSRCSPADSVRVVLLKLQGLLDRPHFGVRPLNEAAALEWLLDRGEPRAAASDAAAPDSPPDPERGSLAGGAGPPSALRQATL